MGDGGSGRRSEAGPDEVIRVDLALRAGRREPDFPSLMRRRGALGEPLVPDGVGLSPVLMFRRPGSFRLDVHPPAGYAIKLEGDALEDQEPWLRWSAMDGQWGRAPDLFDGASVAGGALRLCWKVPEIILDQAWVCQLGLVDASGSGDELRALLGLAVRGSVAAAGDR